MSMCVLLNRISPYVLRVPWALAMGTQSNNFFYEHTESTVFTKLAYDVFSLTASSIPTTLDSPSSILLELHDAALAVVLPCLHWAPPMSVCLLPSRVRPRNVGPGGAAVASRSSSSCAVSMLTIPYQ